MLMKISDVDEDKRATLRSGSTKRRKEIETSRLERQKMLPAVCFKDGRRVTVKTLMRVFSGYHVSANSIGQPSDRGFIGAIT